MVVVSKSPVIGAGLCALVRQGVNYIKLTRIDSVDELESNILTVDLFLLEWDGFSDVHSATVTIKSTYPKALVWVYCHQPDQTMPVWLEEYEALWISSQCDNVFWTGIVSQLYEKKRDPVMPTSNRELSRREIDVLRCVASGMRAKEIAKKLFISVKTVDRHKSNIMSKIGVNSQLEMARYAIREGWVNLSSEV